MKKMFDDSQLKKSNLSALLDILNDAVLNNEYSLTISQLQRRISQTPYYLNLSREEIERTLHWGSIQPYATEDEFVKPQISRDSRYREAWTVVSKK